MNEINEILKEYANLPVRIQEEELKLLSTNSETNKLKFNLEITEAEIKQAVSNETTSEGKPVFTNETRRNAEYLSRRSQNQKVGLIEQELDEKVRESKVTQILIERLKRDFKVKEIIISILKEQRPSTDQELMTELQNRLITQGRTKE